MLPAVRWRAPDCVHCERDAAVEKWLREEVIGVCDAVRSDTGRAIPGERVFATIRARHGDRLKKKRRDYRVKVSVVRFEGTAGAGPPRSRRFRLPERRS